MKREPLQFQSPGQFNTPLSMLQMFSPRVTHAYEVAGENANKRSTHSEGEGWRWQPRQLLIWAERFIQFQAGPLCLRLCGAGSHPARRLSGTKANSCRPLLPGLGCQWSELDLQAWVGSAVAGQTQHSNSKAKFRVPSLSVTIST